MRAHLPERITIIVVPLLAVKFRTPNVTNFDFVRQVFDWNRTFD